MEAGKSDMRGSLVRRGMVICVPAALMVLSATAQAHDVSAASRSQPNSGPAASGRVLLTPAQVRSLSKNVADKVIVMFRNQLPGLPDTSAGAARRTATVRSLQAGVLSQLTLTRARNVRSISLINAVAATVSPGEARLLAANPAVAQVVPDLPIPLGPLPVLNRPAQTRGAKAVPSGTKAPPGTCARGGKVQLNPEAVEAIHAATQSGKGDSAQALGYTGAGVKVAYLADQLDPDNPDFIRANGQHVFVDYKDFSGDGTNAPNFGTEAWIDASAIAAQGRHVYDLSRYGFGSGGPCRIRILGVAPGASLVGLIPFGAGDEYNSEFLAAINYAVTVDHVNVINESFASNMFPDTASLDLTKMANDAAVTAGVTVTVSAGDAGPASTIGSPATDPKVISAGASTTYRFYAQTGFDTIPVLPAEPKGWIDDNISGLSSGGFDQHGQTLDVVAPGDLNWALCTPDPARNVGCTNFAPGTQPAVEESGGTSESAPLTAGVAALVIQAYRAAHRGQDPSPAVVRQIIMSTAQDIDAPADQQGAGLIDAYQAVRAAASYPGGTRAPAGHAILASATQLSASGQPGSSQRLSETLTNDGAGTVTAGLSSRTLSPYRSVVARTLALTAAGSDTSVVRFRVTSGQARLNIAVAAAGVVNISLIAPDGDLAEYNFPQGFPSNFGSAQVADPAPGRWQAIVTVFASAAKVAAHFQASTATWQPFGTLSARSLTLAPGGSGTFTLTVPTPGQPGDQAGSITVRNSARSPAFAAVTSIPVTLRSLVPAPAPAVTFTGTLTGGIGRQPDVGQTAYYQVSIPAGLKALNAEVSTGNPGNTLFAELISPSGLPASTALSSLLETTASGAAKLVPQDGTQLHVPDPAAGLWTLAVNFYNAVSGTAVAQPFTVTINDTPVTASAAGLPDSASTQLTPGVPVTARLQITNTGSTPEAYFTDARLGSQVTVELAPQTRSSLKLPNDNGTIPTYLVPSETTSVTTRVSAAQPVYFDFSLPFGDPDLISSTGKTAAASYSAQQVPDGNWTVTPSLAGPTGPKARKTVLAHVSMTATTAAFDPAVTSPTGDLWLASVHRTAGFTPYVVSGGQSVTIPVTIIPRGTLGSVVAGTIYIDDSWLVPGALTYNLYPGNYPESSEVAAFSYSYTIK